MNRPTEKFLRVLLVEDNVDDAELLIIALRKVSGNILVGKRVESEVEMRAAFQEAQWDVVLSDFNLPGFSVYEALSIQRELDEHVPFIVVSAAIGEENVVALMKDGVCDFVMKDKLARLSPVIDRALTDATARREHRHALNSLRENEKLLQGVTAALGEGLLVQSAAGGLMIMNPEAEKMLGWSAHELSGKNVINTIYWQTRGNASASASGFSSELLELVADGSICRTEDDIFICKDGSPMQVSFVASPIIELGVVIALVFTFQNISLRKKTERDLILSRERLRELSVHLQSVREEERSRFARELHDGMGQMLAAIKLDAAWLSARLSKDSLIMQNKAVSMIDLIDRTVEAMRRMAANLRPVMLDDLGLSAAIEWLAEDVAEHANLHIRLMVNMDDREDELGEVQNTALYRIAQECLNNIVRHASANNAVISLWIKNNKVRLCITDDGVGLYASETSRDHSYGVLGMRERVYDLGGLFVMSSTPDGGVRVEVEMPLSSVKKGGCIAD